MPGIKSFIAGALTGVVVTSMAFWLARSSDEDSIRARPAQPLEAAGSRDGERPQPRTIAAPASTITDSIRNQPQELSEAAAATATRPPDNTRIAAQTRSARAGDAEEPTDAAEKDSDSSTSASSWPPSREELAREAKDAGWSHYMEQTLQQYLATHPRATDFDFMSIDCRTTHCEIQARGRQPDAWPVWQLVMFDVRQQPWNEFDMSAGEILETEQGPVLAERLHRRGNRK